jgi:hypothetical protein
MKKSMMFFLVLVSLLVISSPAFALQCKQGNDASDECWTNVKVGAGYTTLVSRGHVLVASVSGKTVADNDGFIVKLSTASAENVIGVAQDAIASGQTAMILVKGRGVVKLDNASSTVASGDALSNLASGSAVEQSVANNDSKAKVGTALEAQSAITTEATGEAAHIYAYIDVV